MSGHVYVPGAVWLALLLMQNAEGWRFALLMVAIITGLLISLVRAIKGKHEGAGDKQN